MSTLALLTAHATPTHATVAETQPSPDVQGAPGLPTGVVLSMIVAVLMLVWSMKRMHQALAPVAQLLRMAFAAFTAFFLIAAATVLLVVVLVASMPR